MAPPGHLEFLGGLCRYNPKSVICREARVVASREVLLDSLGPGLNLEPCAIESELSQALPLVWLGMSLRSVE